MEPLYDITSVRLLLRRGIASGHWTLEDLDKPTPGYKQLCEEMSRHKVVELRSFPVPPVRNPLRDPEAAATVTLSDPRDFTPTAGQTPALEPPAPVSAPSDDHRPEPDEEEALPF